MTKEQVKRLTDAGFYISNIWNEFMAGITPPTVTEVLDAIPRDLTVEKEVYIGGTISYTIRETFGRYSEYLGEANTLEEATVLAYENYQKGKQDQQV
jgi:hypothetical protein